MRSVGFQPSSEGLAHGDHACWAFADEQELRRALSQALTAARQHHERLVVLLDQSRDDPLALLGELGAASLLDTGQLTVGDTHEVYSDSALGDDPAARVRAFEALARRAREDGYAGIRVLADNTPQVIERRARLSWLEYERLADDMMAVSSVVGVCAFDLRALDGDAVRDIACVHAAQGGTNRWPSSFSLYRVDETLILRGEVDLDDRERFPAALRGSRARGVTRLDLAELDFIDANGLQTLMRWVHERRREGPLAVVGPKPLVQRCWRIFEGS